MLKRFMDEIIEEIPPLILIGAMFLILIGIGVLLFKGEKLQTSLKATQYQICSERCTNSYTVTDESCICLDTGEVKVYPE